MGPFDLVQQGFHVRAGQHPVTCLQGFPLVHSTRNRLRFETLRCLRQVQAWLLKRNKAPCRSDAACKKALTFISEMRFLKRMEERRTMKVFFPRPVYRGAKQLPTEGRHWNEASVLKLPLAVKDLWRRFLEHLKVWNQKSIQTVTVTRHSQVLRLLLASMTLAVPLLFWLKSKQATQ